MATTMHSRLRRTGVGVRKAQCACQARCDRAEGFCLADLPCCPIPPTRKLLQAAIPGRGVVDRLGKAPPEAKVGAAGAAHLDQASPEIPLLG